MAENTRAPQRNALVPSLIAAAVLFSAPLILATDWYLVVYFVTAIFALIVGWFAVQAGQWWWAPVFLTIAILWNPVYPFGFDGDVWQVAQPVAAVIFIVAGALIKTRPA